jgi:hypothetical protein
MIDFQQMQLTTTFSRPSLVGHQLDQHNRKANRDLQS